MRAIQLDAPSLDALKTVDLPEPTSRPSEALLKLHAASLNFIDIAVATGGLPVPRFPIIPVADGAGEIVEIGVNDLGLKAGDKVIPHFMSNWQGGSIAPQKVAAMRGVTSVGSLAEFVAVPVSSLVRLPTHLDFTQGSTLPIVATTAWNALQTGRIGPGSVVALLGTGGLSIMTLQLAKAAGATVVIMSSSEEKLARAATLGADHLVNYKVSPEWDAKVLEVTDGHGADLVLDTVGQATFARSLKAAAFGGTVFTVGFLTGTAPSINLLDIVVKALNVVGNNTGSTDNLAAAARAIESHRIVPVISETYAFNDAAAAYARLAAQGQHFGKIAIQH
ncbi:zinc-dependent alcohol dehydrogenase family protein [Rhizobium lusitanum]|uniref:NADPH:quinone reductase-like Zn-dependent oxidoreductase n=1 Tax=Rhizobium lusitanum TaxID=293958 RepID=A0A7X0ME42_9HYPH|nr:NAD(P)-dependent alcohol dehydrogenase [Rhizobium lusitanum]MBB6487101.1 NADPH:quinone reductase-like Zn-dependent oxidoreductase [Rhizobium lusitanum]